MTEQSKSDIKVTLSGGIMPYLVRECVQERESREFCARAPSLRMNWPPHFRFFATEACMHRPATAQTLLMHVLGAILAGCDLECLMWWCWWCVLPCV